MRQAPVKGLGFTGNAFNALCELADKERWCWKIVCTTCGHGDFRWGLQALAHGDHPESPDWAVSPTRRRLSVLRQRYGPELPRGGWPLDLQTSLQGVVAEASVAQLQAKCHFPDWLGYLGLALFYTEDAEESDPLVTRAFCPQMHPLVGEDTPAAKLVLRLAGAAAGERLRWSDLGLIEQSLQPMR